MRPPGFFVAGTDTDVGKSLVAAALIKRMVDDGLRVSGYKPVAAGCEQTAAGLRNDDALLLQRYANVELAYEQINPVALAPPIAPHLAAAQVGVRLDLDALAAGVEVHRAQSDCVVVEGAGGWLVPLDAEHTLADLAVALQLPVVLVVGMRLGCISHTLLTAQAIANSGLALAGWVANRIDPQMSLPKENIDTLTQRLAAPLLGEVPWQPRASVVDTAANLERASALWLKNANRR